MFTKEFLEEYRDTMLARPLVEKCRDTYKNILEIGMIRQESLKTNDGDGFYDLQNNYRLFEKYLKETVELTLVLQDSLREARWELGEVNLQYLRGYLKGKYGVKQTLEKDGKGLRNVYKMLP